MKHVHFYVIGVWIIVTLLPSLYLNQRRIDKPLTKTDYIGWSIWLFGFIFEVIADKQKTAFKNDINNNVEKLIFYSNSNRNFSICLGKIYSNWSLEIFSTSELFW